MTTEIEPFRPPGDTVPAVPTVLRLHNPWTVRLLAGCAVAVGAVAGSYAGNAVFDAEALDGVAGVAFAAALLVAVLAWRQSRFEADSPASAFRPVDSQVTGGVR